MDNWLFHGDCLEEMSYLKDKSIDFILTDPPYGTTACKWDSVISFEPMWKELKRVRKDSAAIALFGSEPFSSHLRMSNMKEFKCDWIWEKNRPANITAKKQPMKYHEIISIFGGSIFYKQMVMRSQNGLKRMQAKAGFTQSYKTHNSKQHTIRVPIDRYDAILKNPTDILKFNRDNRTFHPTQKPVPLLEYLIKTYTLEGETVLDFTMGSGSTGVACKNLNRNFIGIEKDEKYFEIAMKRIRK